MHKHTAVPSDYFEVIIIVFAHIELLPYADFWAREGLVVWGYQALALTL
jgi:hypothetical protein